MIRQQATERVQVISGSKDSFAGRQTTEDHQPTPCSRQERVRARLVLQRAPRAGAGCPCPLKIEAAQVSSDVHDFSDEEQAGNFSALHGFRRQFVGVHASRGHFGFAVALSTGRNDSPAVYLCAPVSAGKSSSSSRGHGSPATGRQNGWEGICARLLASMQYFAEQPVREAAQ